MRKPARNGNPGALDPNLAQQRRHFLRGRWRDPSLEEDERFLRIAMSALPHQQVASASELLTEFSRLVADKGPTYYLYVEMCDKADWIDMMRGHTVDH